jgi:hypothetical protein
MRPHSRVGNGSSAGSLDDLRHNGRRRGGMAISARHRLLSDSWMADVESLEGAIGRFSTERHLTNNSEVVFFEIVGDEYLHVNVTHRYATKAVSGWAGPGLMPGGFVHNRRFGDTTRNEMIRHIRDIVFAARM